MPATKQKEHPTNRVGSHDPGSSVTEVTYAWESPEDSDLAGAFNSLFAIGDRWGQKHPVNVSELKKYLQRDTGPIQKSLIVKAKVAVRKEGPKK